MSKKKSISNKSKTESLFKDEWRTNPVFFEMLNREFRFNVDIAANERNKLCKRFFSKKNSALDENANWLLSNGKFPSAFMNPPFSLFDEFLKRANLEIKKAGKGVIVALIRGDSPEVKWFRENLIGSDGYPLHEIRNYYPRVRFLNHLGEEKKNIGFPTSIVVMRSKRISKVVWKPWREKDLKIPFEVDRKLHYQGITFNSGNHPPFP